MLVYEESWLLRMRGVGCDQDSSLAWDDKARA